MAKRDWRKVEGYDDILDSLALPRPDGSPEYVSVRICEGQPLSASEVFPPVDLWLPPGHFPKLDGLRKLIQKGLVEIGHPASAPLVDSLLPLVPMTPDVGRGMLAWLFSSFRATSVTQTLDHHSLINYTIMVSSILYFQRNTTGATLISSKY